jgi:glucokinase
VSSKSILVGDMGGTHARFAILERNSCASQLRAWSDIPDDFPTFAQALRHYLNGLGRVPVPNVIALAVAGPVVDGKVSLTNRNWQLSESEPQSLGFQSAHRDFAALACAADRLGPSDVRCVGPDIPAAPEGAITRRNANHRSVR